MLVLTSALQENQKEDIWQLLKLADKEFVPALSARKDTTQQNLVDGEASQEGPTSYYTQMLSQSFVLYVEDGKVLGFLSFIPDRELEVGDHLITCDYISTIVVSQEYRNRGITRRMYETLFKERSKKTYVTRTWSGNDAHLHLLEDMGFQLIWNIENDRGPGIDTVYYKKEDTKDE